MVQEDEEEGDGSLQKSISEVRAPDRWDAGLIW